MALPKRFPGHAIVRQGPGDYRCKCGNPLKSGFYGDGRRGARDAMNYHRMDLGLAALAEQAQDVADHAARIARHSTQDAGWRR